MIIFLNGFSKYDAVYDDDDAQYEKTFEYEHQNRTSVAKPFSPQNVSPVRETKMK
ncbi:MAG: hypothetical protein CM1200mP23_0480 [Nitrososphaerota archaeon]|nr:MAG: hypothetical protein CM1200mP23_0480 [Nitrososphaerota archaeon]